MKQNKRKRKRKKRANVYNSNGEIMTRHHIINKCNKGTGVKNNIYYMTREKHDAWHLLFCNLSFREAGLLILMIDENRTLTDYIGD